MQQKLKLRRLVLLTMVLLGGYSIAQARGLDRGHRVLVDRGLQLQAWAYPGATGYFDLVRWDESNFTTVGLSGGGYGGVLPGPPGIPWTRIMYLGGGYPADLDDVDISSGEHPHLSNLINLQVNDEQDINDPAELAQLAKIFANMRSLYPDVIMHTNQSGRQFSIGDLRTYMQQTQPDMLMFDDYPFTLDIHPFGIPPWIYGAMAKYRMLGLEGNDGTGNRPIPVGQYTQTYVPGHIVSESEIRLNNFSSWAFGFKLVQSFIYDSNNGTGPLPAMFKGDGTKNPTPQFYYVAETNRQSLNLGPTLVRLISTDVHVILNGRSGQPQAPGESSEKNRLFFWESSADPYMTAIKATNLGTQQDSLPGDVIVGYFEPLDASFTNHGHEKDIYFMIVNGLSDRNGSAADCIQKIRLEFDFGDSHIDSLLRLSRKTGQVEEVSLIHDGGSLYHLDLTLDGGTGDLFKFNNGGTFVSGPYVPHDAQTNLVYNGDMEIGETNATTPPDGWAPNGNAAAGSSTGALPGGGLRSATLARVTDGTPTLSQTISGLTSETDYVFDFWFKGPLVKVSMLNGRSKFVDRNCFWEWYHDPQHPSPEHHWTHVTHYDYGPDPWVITTPAGCTTITLVFTYGFAGGNPIFLDNVSLSPLLPPDGNVKGSE